MPKMKTNSGAKKRFAITWNRKIKRKNTLSKSHIPDEEDEKTEKKPDSFRAR